MHLLTISHLATMPRGDLEEGIRSRVQSVYIGEGRVLTRVLGCQKMYLSTADTGFAGHVMLDGFWEIWLTQFFARTIQPGMTVIDVGANFGYYTLLFSEAVGPEGRVLAIEPVPQTAALLSRTITLNGYMPRTRLERVALGALPRSQVQMYMPPGEPKNASIVKDEIPGQTFPVPSTNLDTLAANYERIDLIKIDAEGAEESIFAGMNGILARHRPRVLLEFNASRSTDSAAFLSQLRGHFRSIRYLDFNSSLVDVTDTELLSVNIGEDWLLYLEP